MVWGRVIMKNPNVDTANDQMLKETELIYFKPKQKVRPNQNKTKMLTKREKTRLIRN